jgi:hypothetical protein
VRRIAGAAAGSGEKVRRIAGAAAGSGEKVRRIAGAAAGSARNRPFDGRQDRRKDTLR